MPEMADARAPILKSQIRSARGGLPPKFLSLPTVEDSIQVACDRLDFLPRRPELATEHLLLGLVSADHEVAVWLRQQGLDPDAIEAEIRSLHGYTVVDMPAVIDYEEELPTYRTPDGDGPIVLEK